MWTASVAQPSGVKYTHQQLAALLFFVNYELERAEGNSEGPLRLDDECGIHYEPFLQGITCGEYFHCVARLLGEALNDSPPREHAPFENAILCSFLDHLEEDFLNAWEDDKPLRQAIWDLYKFCREQAEEPIWETDAMEPTEPPPIDDITADQWETVFDTIRDAFFKDEDWRLDLFGGNFALRDEQPHWPTFQEYRTSKAWIHYMGELVRQQWEPEEAKQDLKKKRKGQRKAPASGNETV